MNAFGNWQDTEAISARAFERSVSRAQHRHDYREPPEDCAEVGHKWHYRGTAPDGTRFMRCTRCRLEVEA